WGLLGVSVTSCPPLGYQWYFNQITVVTNATNATLGLTNIGLGQGGNYLVVITNGYGSVTSAPASVVVVTCGSDRTVEVGTMWDFDTPLVVGINATVTVVGTVTNLGCGESLSATRTWAVRDEEGDQVTCSQTVQVVDTGAPVVSGLSNKSVVLGTAWAFDVPQAQDAGVVAVVVYHDGTNDWGSLLEVGTEEVGDQITLAGTERYARRFV